jgi:hypothetical protein
LQTIIALLPKDGLWLSPTTNDWGKAAALPGFLASKKACHLSESVVWKAVRLLLRIK